GRERRPHAGDGPVGSRAFEDRSVRRPDLIREWRRSLSERFRDRRERQLRCDLSAAMPAHPVRDGVQRRLEQVRVLVPRAYLPHVGRDPGLDLHRASSRTVVPTRTRSPAVSIAGAANRCSFTKVPFVEPRSSTYHEPFFPNILACSCDTYVSSSRRSHPIARPMTVLAASRSARGFSLPSTCTRTFAGTGWLGDRSEPARATGPGTGAAGLRSTFNPRTTHRIERHRNRKSNANSPYLRAESANGSTAAASTTPSGTRSPWCRP